MEEINLAFAFALTTLAGLSTGIGSTIAYFIRKPKYSYLAVLLGFSAGVMIYISFAELLGGAIDEIGFEMANIFFFVGIALIAIVDLLIPHNYIAERVENKDTMLMRAGIFTALGIAIHNFPEGLATFAAAATGDARLGISIATAIAIHNIPEGISVSVPIFYATGSRRKAFFYSFGSGIAEPVGALIGYAILLPFLSQSLISGLLALVAGIMIYISLDELLPLAHRYGGEHHALMGLLAGMAVMAISLWAFH
jgi:ZIP family zinc transporter